jgi:hypothetical protein
MGGFGAIGEYALGQEALDDAAPGATLSLAAVLLAGGASVTVSNGSAPGDVVEVDLALLPGAATGNGSLEIGWGPPRLYLRPNYQLPRQQIDGFAPGAVLTVGQRFIPGRPAGDAVASGRVFAAGFELIPGCAFAGASSRRVAAFEASRRRPGEARRRISANPSEHLPPAAVIPDETWAWRNPWKLAADVADRAPAAPVGPSGWFNAADAGKRAAGRPRSSTGWRRAGG